MRYRILSAAAVHQIASSLVAGEHASVDVHSVDRGDGSTVDEELLQETLEPFRQELSEGDPPDNEVFEGRLASAIHGWFDSLPIEVLDDRGFWRYLSVRYFWWFISWRESEPIKRGNFKNLVDATLPAEQVPLRLYLRARAIADGQDTALAGEIPKSTDFWRSHVVRVRVGTAPNVARALATAKRDEDSRGQSLKTERLRRVARRVNRMWSNVYLDLYDPAEGSKFIDEVIESET